MSSRLASATLVLSLLAPIEAWDQHAEFAIQASRRPALERPMHALTNGCNPTTLLAALLGIAAFGGPAGVETARLAIATLIPTNLVVEGLKRLTDRTRPDGEHKRSNASFPSSHAANAFAMAVVLARRWRRFAPWGFLIAAAVGWSRLYLNRHFPTDVLIGALLGTGTALGVAWLANRRAAARAAAKSGT